ncbi:cyclopropane-fatty-acyl-phospholipid synthase, partial [Bacillus thuringiensis]|nr:cyclopropane-fatty-acyl-phospholipid synthase [Bacillus thuringiensis]
FEKILDEQEQE